MGRVSACDVHPTLPLLSSHTSPFFLIPQLPDEVADKLLRFGMEDEEAEEQRVIEERRKRLAEIKAKHQQAAAVAGERLWVLSVAAVAACELCSRIASGEQQHVLLYCSCFWQCVLTCFPIFAQSIPLASLMLRGFNLLVDVAPLSSPSAADSIINPTAASLAAKGDASAAPSAPPATPPTAAVAGDEDADEEPAAPADGGEEDDIDSEEGGSDDDVEGAPVLDIFDDRPREGAGAEEEGGGGSLMPPPGPGAGTELQHTAAASVAAAKASVAAKKPPVAAAEEDKDDMFASEDPEDMFGAGEPAAGGAARGGGPAASDAVAAAPVAALADAYDDHEGYYVFQVGGGGSIVSGAVLCVGGYGISSTKVQSLCCFLQPLLHARLTPSFSPFL